MLNTHNTSFTGWGVKIPWLALALLAVSMLLLTVPVQAYAQAMSDMPSLDDLRNADSNNYAIQVLGKLLGERFVNDPLTALGTATDFLGKLFFIFNASLFVIGVGFTLYIGVTMVAVSAHEGEVLGKRMSSLWIPIRIGTGIFGMA